MDWNLPDHIILPIVLKNNENKTSNVIWKYKRKQKRSEVRNNHKKRMKMKRQRKIEKKIWYLIRQMLSERLFSGQVDYLLTSIGFSLESSPMERTKRRTERKESKQRLKC